MKTPPLTFEVCTLDQIEQREQEQQIATTEDSELCFTLARAGLSLQENRALHTLTGTESVN